MANVTPQTRERIYQAISNDWSDQRILSTFKISQGSLAAYKAHITMGTWKPARRPRVAPQSRRSSSTRSSTSRNMNFSVPKGNLSVTYKGNTAFVSVSL